LIEVLPSRYVPGRLEWRREEGKKGRRGKGKREKEKEKGQGKGKGR
jgi:hypothetical protein